MKLYNNIYKFYRRLFKFYYKKSYSQAGEDMMLDIIFRGRKDGFYIDVGANNPFQQSNTCFLYNKGWSGINIDALPDSMNLFEKYRRRDINLEIAISDVDSTLEYFMFESSFYNTFCKEKADAIKNVSKLKEKKEISTEKLSGVLKKYCDKEIDLLTIDVEGFDFNVIKSNDWNLYRPKIVIVETFNHKIEDIGKDEITIYLRDKGYRVLCNTITNSFFIDNKFYIERFTN